MKILSISPKRGWFLERGEGTFSRWEGGTYEKHTQMELSSSGSPWVYVGGGRIPWGESCLCEQGLVGARTGTIPRSHILALFSRMGKGAGHRRGGTFFGSDDCQRVMALSKNIRFSPYGRQSEKYRGDKIANGGKSACRWSKAFVIFRKDLHDKRSYACSRRTRRTYDDDKRIDGGRSEKPKSAT